MAKAKAYTGEDTVSEISEFAVPDKASLGWSPAEHVIIHPSSHEMVAEFYGPTADSGEEASVIDFELADVTVGSLLVDIDGHDTDSFNLDELLNKTEFAPELAVVTMPDDADSTRSEERDDPRDANLPENAQTLAELVFPPLTVVIEDESGSETVAL